MKKTLTEKQTHYIRTHAGEQSVEQMAKAVRVDPEDVILFLNSLHPETSRWKQRLFSTMMITLPIVFLLLLELGLRLFQYGGDLRLFLPMQGDMADYYQINNEVARRYFFMQETVPTPGRDLFLKKKPENGTRIFVLGGSTAAGYPFGNNLMFSRILGRRLSDVFPERRIEVINVAMSAINSYSLLDFTDEIVDQDPDLILIYAGHNEFYGAMGVGSMESLGKKPALVRSYMKLKKFRIFLMMRNIVGLLRKSVSRTLHGGTEVDPTATLMARIVGKKSIPYGGDLYNRGLEQFESNLDGILAKCRKAGVPVVLSELVSNIRDQKPFVSEATEAFPAADEVYRQAVAKEQQGKFKEARPYYLQAKDLDALRFRATEEMNALIHKTAPKYEAAVVPMKSVFEEASEHQLVGDNLMTDHLHPNMNGYFLMADAFFETLRSESFIQAEWDENNIRPSGDYQKTWGVTALDSANAALSVFYLKGGWPFQPESQPNHALSNYHPRTLVDSLALKILTEPGVNLEKAHLRLGEYYTSRGEYGKAFREYNALLTMVPHEMEFYERAAEVCLKEKKWKKAYAILMQSLNVRETPFNMKWIGQIHLLLDQVEIAVPILEKARAMAPDDAQVLFNLGRAYIHQDQAQQAVRMYRRLRALEPRSQYTQTLGRMIQQKQEEAEDGEQK